MAIAAAPIDATRCPLCGASNLCAVEVARTSGEPQGECWCMAADFSLAPLALLPDAARGAACICARCAAGQAREKNPLS